jgi:TrmH family RNA methyltransferase
VIAASAVADWGNPNVVRASKATVFSVPVASGASEDVIGWLRERSLQIVVATPETDRELGDIDLRGPSAIVVGAEHEGVSRTWHAAADVSARLAMTGEVNSLNVATSAAIFVYEALRQRRG